MKKDELTDQLEAIFASIPRQFASRVALLISEKVEEARQEERRKDRTVSQGLRQQLLPSEPGDYRAWSRGFFDEKLEALVGEDSMSLDLEGHEDAIDVKSVLTHAFAILKKMQEWRPTGDEEAFERQKSSPKKPVKVDIRGIVRLAVKLWDDRLLEDDGLKRRRSIAVPPSGTDSQRSGVEAASFSRLQRRRSDCPTNYDSISVDLKSFRPPAEPESPWAPSTPKTPKATSPHEELLQQLAELQYHTQNLQKAQIIGTQKPS